MKGAEFFIFPSVWYETMGIVLLEAYAVGLPVLGSRLGSRLSLIDHGRTGLHFHPNDQDDLLTQARWMLSHPAEMNSMRREARAEYESKYTAERNYRILMGVYESVLHARKETA
jgi:glycosyltransferase involved in cell wall biosynthesis